MYETNKISEKRSGKKEQAFLFFFHSLIFIFKIGCQACYLLTHF